MNIIAQMTPYGIYDLKYTKKTTDGGSTNKAVPSASIAKLYDTAVFPSLLRSQFISAKTSISQNDYKQSVFSVMSTARGLSDAAERIIEESWPKPKADTTNSVSVKLEDDATLKEYLVDVVQLGQNQNFKSKPLPVNMQNFAENGTYSIIIGKGGNIQKAAFSLSSNDNLRFVVYKVADAINNFSKIAYAETHESDDYISLSVNATISGKDGQFDLYDDVGDVLKKLSMTLEQQGQDSFVRINNEEYTGKNNSLLLDDGKVRLDFYSSGKSLVDIVPDSEQSFYALQSLVNNYNKFKDSFSLADNTTKRVDEMFSTFKNLFNTRFNDEGLAIRLDESGFLQLNKDACISSLEKNPLLINEIKSNNTDMASVLYNMANSITQNPLSTYFTSLTTNSGIEIKFNGIVVDLIA